VRVVKERYGLTYYEFAQLTGMSSDSLWSLAIGRRNLSMLSRICIQQIVDALEADPSIMPEKRDRHFWRYRAVHGLPPKTPEGVTPGVRPL